MLYREIMAVSQIHTKHINTPCGQNGELLNVKHKVTTGLCTVQQYQSRHICLTAGSGSLHISATCDVSRSLSRTHVPMTDHLTCALILPVLAMANPSSRPLHSPQKSPYFTYVMSHVRIRFSARDSPKRRPLHSV